MMSNIALLKEMKKVRTGGGVFLELSGQVDGVEGEEAIVQKFKEVYSTLYNSAGSSREVQKIKDKTKGLINDESIEEVHRSHDRGNEAVDLFNDIKTPEFHLFLDANINCGFQISHSCIFLSK